MTATSQERYNRTQERNEKRRSESAFALLELSKPSTTEDQANTYIDESNCKACKTDITAEYFTETLENAAGLIRRSQVAGHRSQVAGHRSQVAGRRSQVTGRRSQVAGHRSQVTGRRSQVTGRRSQVAGHRSQVACRE